MPWWSPISPGEVIKEVLERGPACISNLHREYKERMKKHRLRGMTYASFRTYVTRARIAGLVEPVGEEPMEIPPKMPNPLVGIRDTRVVTATRRLYALTDRGRAEVEMWRSVGTLKMFEIEEAPPEIEEAPPEIQERCDELARRITGWKRPRPADAERFLSGFVEETEKVGIEVTGIEEALDLLQEYRVLTREDFDTTDEFREARADAWQEFLDSLDEVELTPAYT